MARESTDVKCIDWLVGVSGEKNQAELTLFSKMANFLCFPKVNEFLGVYLIVSSKMISICGVYFHQREGDCFIQSHKKIINKMRKKS